MIKRRFYRFEHGDEDAPSESSSSSDSDVEAEAADDTEVEDEEEEDIEEENVVSDMRDKGEASSSSGYESEDSSANEVNLDSSGFPTSDEDVAVQNGMPNVLGSFAIKGATSLLSSALHSPEKDAKTDVDTADYVLKRKSVFKCRICPRIVCLSEETIKAHLSSKRHARSEKLLKEGRLKLMLNENGKIEGEFPADDHATTTTTTTVPGQKASEPNKKGKGKGRWKQRKRSRQTETKLGEDRPLRENREKRRKNEKTILTSKRDCSS